MQNFQRFNAAIILPKTMALAVIANAIQSILEEKNIEPQEFIDSSGTIEYPEKEIWITFGPSKNEIIFDESSIKVWELNINMLGHGIIVPCTEACKELEAIAVHPFRGFFEDDDEHTSWDEFYKDDDGQHLLNCRIVDAINVLKEVAPGISMVLPEFVMNYVNPKANCAGCGLLTSLNYDGFCNSCNLLYNLISKKLCYDMGEQAFIYQKSDTEKIRVRVRTLQEAVAEVVQKHL